MTQSGGHFQTVWARERAHIGHTGRGVSHKCTDNKGQNKPILQASHAGGRRFDSCITHH
jgi:hypothetical protein